MNKLSYDILFHKIVPFISESNDLLKFKCVNKYFNENIKTHNLNLICYKCNRNRFNITSNTNDCYVKNCMSSDKLHYSIKYWYDNKPFCSFSCSSSYYLRKTNQYFTNNFNF
jgi:hypothetical protein